VPSSAPLLETERLLLRSFQRSDLDAHAATLGDPDVMRFVGGSPLNREDVWKRLLSTVGGWAVIGFGAWAVENKADGRMLGHLGFFEFERDMEPSIRGEPEMGWIFDRSAHGQGFAYEAGMAALAWADANLDAPSYPAIIALENAPSMRLAEKFGFERHGEAVYKGETLGFFRRPTRRG